MLNNVVQNILLLDSAKVLYYPTKATFIVYLDKINYWIQHLE